MSFVCCQISPAASRSPSCCVHLMVSAAATISGMGSGIGCLGLRFPVKERSRDSLELMVGHKCALPEIDGLPVETKDLTLAKPENHNQYVSGVKRIGVGTRGFEKAPGLLARPWHRPALALLGNLYELSNIPVDQLLATAECSAERRTALTSLIVRGDATR